ncbi:C40 family peptidase [Nonomuraea sp. CA-218870]|uniref:C40 family peptidase n=1 Tax=Nonomuraea sp. CA-218870 TaxID=3239998 RepID=UPI003D9347BA
MHVRAGILLACLTVTLSPPAHAEPAPPSRDVAGARQDVRSRSRELARAAAALAEAQAKLEELAAEAERRVEAYNGALVRLRRAEEAHGRATARLASAEAEVERARQPVALLAARAYGGMGLPAAAVPVRDAGGHEGFLHRAATLRQLGGERAAVLSRMRDAWTVAEILRAVAADAHAAQRAAAESAGRARAAAQEAVARQRRETKALAAERDALQRRVDAARDRADLLARRKRAGGLRVPPRRGSSRGDLAANWALTQLGKPYLWAADGPRSFDCSGLTMRAWQRAGVRLDHWTGTQWTSGPRVPLPRLRRGDLLFFGHNRYDPRTIHHVGMYVGRGLMVHAPQAGDVVRVASIWRRDLVGATRPR